MYRLVCRAIVLSFIVLSFSSTVYAGVPPQPESIQTSLCQIRTRIPGKSHQLVEIEADLYNGMPHGLFLGDERCPKQRIQIDFEKTNADGNLIDFDKFVSQNAGNIGLIARGRFRGTVKQDRATGHIYFLLRTVIALQLKGLSVDGPVP